MARNARAESPDSGDHNSNDGKEGKAKSRRPANTAFRQQRLKAWQPILTPKTVLPLFFVVGIIFAPLGGLMLYASQQVEELIIDYSTCAQPENQGGAPVTTNVSDINTLKPVPVDNFSASFKSSSAAGSDPQWVQWSRTVSYWRGQAVDLSLQRDQVSAVQNVTTPVCSLFFQIPDDIGAPSSPVLLYYRLTNFYQNHRRYVKSFDSNQLAGTAVSSDSASHGSSCDPLTLNGTRIYYPCGIVANSMFNDTFSAPLALNAIGAEGPVRYNMTNMGIAWSSDASLYSNSTPYSDLGSIAVPPFWEARWPGGVYSNANPPPLLASYQEFQVWMRTAGLPEFSKLALRNDNETMKAGRYRLDIDMNFPVTEYGGTKSVVISTSSVIGGKNPFLGIAYIVVAGLCVLLGFGFTAAQLIKPRKLGDHTHLTWNNEQSSTNATATSTGVQRPGAGGNDA